MTPATDNREYIRLLEAIKDSTEAIAGQPDSPAVARWLEHRADCYRRLAAEHPRSEMADMARDAADLDQARADKMTTQKMTTEEQRR